MLIGDRLRAFREVKKLSQGDIEKRTGLLRCYVSRVENGHTVPAVETLEKFAKAMEVPLYQLFYEGPASSPPLPIDRDREDETAWGHAGRDARTLNRFRTLIGKMNGRDRDLFFALANHMASQHQK